MAHSLPWDASASRAIMRVDIDVPRVTPLREQLARLVALVAILDVFTLSGGLAIAWIARANIDSLDSASVSATIGSILAPLIVGVWLAALAVRGAYVRHTFGSGSDEFRSLLTGTAVAFGLLCSVAFLTHSNISRAYFLLTFMVGTPLLLAERFAVRRLIYALRSNGSLRGRVVAVCAPSALDEVLQTFARDRRACYTVVGTCVPTHVSEEWSDLPVPAFNGVDNLLAACRATSADTVMVAGGGPPTSRMLRDIGWELEGTDVDLVVVPSLIDVAGPRVHMRRVSGFPLMHVEEPQAGAAGGLAKRSFDLVVGSLLVLAFLPVLAYTAVRIKLHDGGPIVFRHQRVGRDGRPFSCLKFRTMVPDAESRIEDLQKQLGVTALLFKAKDDPRITKPGHWMRRFSVDELPQLFNVLRGDMSLVGPRPQVAQEVELYDAHMSRRLKVRPGMTGLWQVSGRNDLSLEDSVRLDLYYVENWCLTQDLAILARTFSAVFRGHGAY